MVDYDVSTLSGQVLPILGAGIGFSVLAGTSRMVMNQMSGWSNPRAHRAYVSRRYPNRYHKHRRANVNLPRPNYRYRPLGW